MSTQPSSQSSDPAVQAHTYEQAVLAYEKAEKQVIAFLADNGGVSRNLTDTMYDLYRHLAMRRDEAYDRMKRLERGLLDE